MAMVKDYRSQQGQNNEQPREMTEAMTGFTQGPGVTGEENGNKPLRSCWLYPGRGNSLLSSTLHTGVSNTRSLMTYSDTRLDKEAHTCSCE